ncbi:MAG: aspartyl-tRNA amidotransferase [Candidatus Kerfeldbacteria bacterium CG_4_10_14_0_8_um_filter_42_10]|uniref:Aspartyl-tRNA amidotransferase n=1 Tax=Candidatus Kerfeldbacteria bacterium CG_4_10_14_0_8_um_filter_42_10 TaxID=2014248 RepID=A0A2M7RLH7_9BACT|nr:MAG: aspartyl-tRNA amidotransferase [Candidatus Kerfeldbacteria bacterium CG_4_10_14_0_8_um_filter_42_10]
MGLKTRLEQNLKDAIKGKNPTMLGTVRLVMAEIKKEEIAQKRELKEEEIQILIQREIKKRRDAFEAYQKGGRAELAQKEEAEAKILQEYLPEPLSEEELVKIIQAAIKETGAESVKEMGKVMSLVMAKAKGKADGKLVNEKVRQLLS